MIWIISVQMSAYFSQAPPPGSPGPCLHALNDCLHRDRSDRRFLWYHLLRSFPALGQEVQSCHWLTVADGWNLDSPGVKTVKGSRSVVHHRQFVFNTQIKPQHKSVCTWSSLSDSGEYCCSSMLKRWSTTEMEKRMAAKMNKICSWDLNTAPRNVCVQSQPPRA